MTKEELQNELRSRTYEVERLVERCMTPKGDVEADCQMLVLTNRIYALYSAIAGIETEDMK